MRHDSHAAPSRAAIGGHPIHHMLVPFPIAFLIGALFADLALLLTGDPFWARAGHWLIGGGLIGGLAAAVFGLADFIAIERARAVAAGWLHLIGNVTAILLAGWNFLMRFGDSGAAAPGGVILSLATAFILVVTGWLGGELVFRHRIGVMRQREDEFAARPEPAADLAYAANRPAEARPTHPHA